MAEKTPATPKDKDLETVMRALAKKRAAEDFARLSHLKIVTTEKKS